MLSDSRSFPFPASCQARLRNDHPKLTSVVGFPHENDCQNGQLGLYSLQVGTISGLLGSLMFESTGKTFSISALIEVP